jgi:hypothetical protein
MVSILKTKKDRQLWMYLNETQRLFAKRGKCLNLTTDFLPFDIPTRFAFVFIKDAMNEFEIKEHLAMKILFENYLTLHFEDGIFKATQHPTKDTAKPFNLPNAVIRSHAYKQLPVKYQKLVLSKVDMSFEHISELVIC